jgi:branched-chain amino acid transport system permease protein
MLFAEISFADNLIQYLINGVTFGALIALIALGYTMVYGIVELINFAHGDLFMLGSYVCLSLLAILGFGGLGFNATVTNANPYLLGYVLLGCAFVAVAFCAGLNLAVDYIVYRPLRNAPKLAPLVSAIGVGFIFMNIGLFWGGPQDVRFPEMIPNTNLLGVDAEGNDYPIRFTIKDLIVFAVTVPLMLLLTYFVQATRLGKAMRATAQNPTAASLMGINTNFVIGATFVIGGGLAGAASLIYAVTVNTISYQMGFQNGLYAFTAAVLGGIGRIPGAVLGGLVIGLVRSFGSPYVGEMWTNALIFGILILILVFRPTGLLGTRTREKV